MVEILHKIPKTALSNSFKCLYFACSLQGGSSSHKCIHNSVQIYHTLRYKARILCRTKKATPGSIKTIFFICDVNSSSRRHSLFYFRFEIWSSGLCPWVHIWVRAVLGISNCERIERPPMEKISPSWSRSRRGPLRRRDPCGGIPSRPSGCAAGHAWSRRCRSSRSARHPGSGNQRIVYKTVICREITFRCANAENEPSTRKAKVPCVKRYSKSGSWFLFFWFPAKKGCGIFSVQQHTHTM